MLKKVLFSLCIASSGLSVWLMSQALVPLWNYAACSHPIKAETTTWKILEKTPSCFYMEGDYTYHVGQKTYSGKTLFASPAYLNIYAAKADLPFWEKQEWTVWYVPNKPCQSTLQRYFPMQEIVHAFLALAVTLYFLCILKMGKILSLKDVFWKKMKERFSKEKTENQS